MGLALCVQFLKTVYNGLLKCGMAMIAVFIAYSKGGFVYGKQPGELNWGSE